MSLRHLTAAVLALAVSACGAENADRPEVDDPGPQPPEVAPADRDPGDETAYGFDDIDNDGDSELDENEFHEWIEDPVFAHYSGGMRVEEQEVPDQTGALDTRVFMDGIYAAWDRDDDEALNRSEWDAATRVVASFSDTTNAWVRFDADGNQQVDRQEVAAQISNDDILAGMDADEDGEISDTELNRWFFDLFDVNEDGVVSRDEWRMAEIYIDVPLL